MESAENHHPDRVGPFLRFKWLLGPLVLFLLIVGFYWKLVLSDQYTWLAGNDTAYQILPWLQFQAGDSADALHLRGDETFTIHGLRDGLRPQQTVTMEIHRPGQSATRLSLLARIDTPIEADYFDHGGILPYVLRDILGMTSPAH